MQPSDSVCHSTGHGHLALNQKLHNFPQCGKSCNHFCHMQPCGISNSQVVCLHYFCSLLTLSSITFCPSHKKKTTVESVHEPMERERQEFGQRATEYHTLFETATSAFEAKCASIKHRKCDVCQIVTLQDIFKTENLCKSCARTNSWTANFTSVLPLWTNEDGVLQYDVPEQLHVSVKGKNC